jgi:hypothetical protein
MMMSGTAMSTRHHRGRRPGLIATLATGVATLVGLAAIAHAADRPRSGTHTVTQAIGRAATQCGAPNGSQTSTDPKLAMTPYPAAVGADQFLQGATLIVTGSDLDTGALPTRLRQMRDSFHVSTLSIYGMEDWDPAGDTARKDRFFAALRSLGMRAVVRLESYDPDRFAFDTADVSRLLDAYGPLISYVAAPARRDLVAYLALNMPVDDPGVQSRLGGVTSSRFAASQPGYATSAVGAVRRALTAAGAATVPVYLGVFYGWDNTYRTPSYRAAKADGYFLNSYSYPTGAPASASAAEATLISATRLRQTMRLFTGQYGTGAPLVVEYGFQTAAYHGGNGVPDQTAGLVADDAAKRRALVATTRFYCTSYPTVRGTMYFGFNVIKSEGSPPSTLDFALAKNP